MSEMSGLSRRGFLTALLASPLIAKLELSRIIPEEFSIEDFARRALEAQDGDVFLVSDTLYKKLWRAMQPENRYVSEDCTGFTSLLFYGKPVIAYPDGGRWEVVQEMSHHLAKNGRLFISEIK